MAPLLIKVEEILVATRTQRAPRLSSYYLHWEKELFEAVGKLYFSLEQKKIYILMIFTFYLAEMTSRNLEEYSQFLRRKAPQFTIRSVLQQNEVIIEPEAAFVIDGAINVVRRMVENTKRFVRFYRGSYIPIGPVYITGHLDRVLPSFFDEISGLPSIVQKVEVIQTSLIDILKMMFNYLNEWKVKKELIVYCANLHIKSKYFKNRS